MPDSDKTLKIQIDLQKTGTGATDAKADLDQLSNTGKGLATAVPDLEAPVKKFTIATEAEYSAVLRSAEALRERITVASAAGKATGEMEAALANLDAALSTDKALQIARNMEGKAWLAQKLEEITATNAATAATEANTVANRAHAEAAGLNAFQMREITVVAGELERGNYSRLPGSAARLASSFGLLSALFNPVTIGLAGIGVVAYLAYEALSKNIDVANALADNYKRLDDILNGSSGLEAEADAAASLAEKGDHAADATNAWADATRSLTEATREANEALKQKSSDAVEELEAEKKAKLDQVEADERNGKLSPFQAAQRKAQINNEYSAQIDAQKSIDEQKAIDNEKAELAKQKTIAGQAEIDRRTKSAAATGDEYSLDVAKGLAAQAKKDVTAQEDFIKKNKGNWDADTFEKQQGILSGLIDRESQLESAVGDAATKAAESKAAADAAAGALKAANAEIDRLNRQIPGDTTSHTEADRHRDAMHGFETTDQKAQLDATLAKLVQQDAERNKNLVTLLEALRGGAQAANAIILNHIQHSTTQAAEMQALKNAIAVLTAQQNGTTQFNNQ